MLNVVQEIPAVKYQEKPWFDLVHLDRARLDSQIHYGQPSASEHPTCIFLLGPKGCGKTTFLK